MYGLTRSLIRSHALRQGVTAMTASRPVTMKVIPAATAIQAESYEDKNQRLGRELSPHLSIYKPQLTSMLSITHRGTGFALGFYAWGLGLAALMAPQDVSQYATVLEGLQLSAGTLTALKFVLGYPLAYHACNGVRHLLWDTGRFLKIKEVYSTGYAMVAASLVVGVALALV